MEECKKCKYRKLCRELPKDLSCDEVKRIALRCGARMYGADGERKDDENN